jgi:hypothetical protein
MVCMSEYTFFFKSINVYSIVNSLAKLCLSARLLLSFPEIDYKTAARASCKYKAVTACVEV